MSGFCICLKIKISLEDTQNLWKKVSDGKLERPDGVLMVYVALKLQSSTQYAGQATVFNQKPSWFHHKTFLGIYSSVEES